MISECRIEQPEGVGKMQLPRDIDPVAFASTVTRRRPYSDAVNCQKRCLLKWRCKESRRRMGLMMLREDNFTLEIERAADDLFHPDLFLDPDRHGFEERFDSRRC